MSDLAAHNCAKVGLAVQAVRGNQLGSPFAYKPKRFTVGQLVPPSTGKGVGNTDTLLSLVTLRPLSQPAGWELAGVLGYCYPANNDGLLMLYLGGLG